MVKIVNYNGKQSNLCEYKTGNCFVLWIMKTYLPQISPQGVLGKKLHSTKTEELAYVYKEMELGTRSPHKGRRKLEHTLAELVSKHVKRL